MSGRGKAAMSTHRLAIIPGCLALLPRYRSLVDPIAELRAAVSTTVHWLGPEVEVLGSEQGRRIGTALLGERTISADADSTLVVLNGSACRTEKAPGHFDERAEDFDAALAAALFAADPAALHAVDLDLAGELWADVAVLPELADLLGARMRGHGSWQVSVDYDGLPHGVQYWVLRLESPDADHN